MQKLTLRHYGIALGAGTIAGILLSHIGGYYTGRESGRNQMKSAIECSLGQAATQNFEDARQIFLSGADVEYEAATAPARHYLAARKFLSGQSAQNIINQYEAAKEQAKSSALNPAEEVMNLFFPEEKQ